MRAKYVPSDAHLTYLIRIVAAWLWMQGEKTETITKSPLLPDMRHGAVATLTDQLSWFMGALEPLWAALEYQPAIEKVKEEDWESWIKQHQWDIKRFELRLRYGVHEGLESVARLRVRGWHRERLVDLWEQLGKWEHPVELLNCSPQDVELNLQKLFSELQKSVRRRKWSDDPRDVLDRQISLIFQAKHNYDEQYVDPHWNEIIRDLYFCKGLEFIQAVYDALVSKPLQMQATIEKQQAISSTNIALICGSRYVGIVTIGSEKGEIHWSQIASSADMIPDGKSLVSLICVCEVQIADNIEQKLKSSPIPILVLSREAFAQLCARAVDDPDAVDAGDVGDKEKRNRTPAVRRVKTLLENPNNAVFRTSKDIDKELNRDGSEPRIVGDVELIGGREIKTQKNDIARQPINLLRHALQGVDEKLEDFPRHEMVAEEIFTSISEARNLLPSEPVECVAFCKDILEALMRDIYQCKEQETVPDNWNKLIKRLIASEILPNWIVNLTDFEKYIGNQSFSVGTKIQVNDQMVSVQSSITAEEAVMILDNVVRISRWYLLDWSKKVEQSLQAILPAQLAIALSEAFDQDSLEQMLRLRLGKKLFNIVPQGRDFPTIMHKLTERADAEGWIPDLIVAAYAENPDNQEVQAFGQQFERLFIKWGIKVPTK